MKFLVFYLSCLDRGLSSLRFAESIGIHPGVVVGRLQHEKIIAPSRGNSLKQKYYII
jgi:hypothetical protein